MKENSRMYQILIAMVFAMMDCLDLFYLVATLEIKIILCISLYDKQFMNHFYQDFQDRIPI